MKARSARPNANYQSFHASLWSLFCLLFNSALIIQICMVTKILLELFRVSVSGSFLVSLQFFNFGIFPNFIKLLSLERFSKFKLRLIIEVICSSGVKFESYRTIRSSKTLYSKMMPEHIFSGNGLKTTCLVGILYK